MTTEPPIAPQERRSVSVVIPVYRGADSVGEVVMRCRETLAATAGDYEVILVDDGSPDDSWSVIEDLCGRFSEVKGISLERNYGQHNALLAGIRAAENEVVVTLDDDLQNPPEDVPVLIAALTSDVDVVYGKPLDEKQGLFRRLGRKFVVGGLRTLGGTTAPMVTSFRAFRTSLRNGFEAYSGPDVSIDGLLTWQTDRFTKVPVSHEPRRYGESGYSFRALVRHAFTMVTAFSTRPLQLSITLGFLSLVFGLAVLAYVFLRLLIEGDSQPGFPFLASIITIFAGVQLFAIGVIGEYIARIHVRVAGEPSYRISKEVASSAEGETSTRHSDQGKPWKGAVGDLVEVLPWDSEFWGLSIARVKGSVLDLDTAEALGEWCDSTEVDCCYFLCDASDMGSFGAALTCGFQFVDTRLTMTWTARESVRIPKGGGEVSVRPFLESDLEELENIARQAHSDSRFFRDLKFPSEHAAELYVRWLHRGIEETGRELLVATIGEKVCGYVILRGENRWVDLLAVDESTRKQGVGTALLGAAIQAGPGTLSAVTQGANLQALRFYGSLGFRPAKAETWLHRWPKT